MYDLILLGLVVATALAFDFTSGFHDTANAMATKALKPKVAVALSAVLNLVGAFLSFAVAAAIAKGLVEASVVTLPVILAGLCGGIIWKLLTWLLGVLVLACADRRDRRCGAVRCGAVRCGAVRCGAVRCSRP